MTSPLHGVDPNTGILWEKQGNKVKDFQSLPYTGTSYLLSDISDEHAGVYYAYWKGAFVRLIVRGEFSNKIEVIVSYKTQILCISHEPC